MAASCDYLMLRPTLGLSDGRAIGDLSLGRGSSSAARRYQHVAENRDRVIAYALSLLAEKSGVVLISRAQKIWVAEYLRNRKCIVFVRQRIQLILAHR